MQKKIIIFIIVFALLSSCTMNSPFKESPNIVIILTDDMDNALMPYMPKTIGLIGEQGATFDNFFITTPSVPFSLMV